MPLGMEIGLRPDHVVLDEDPTAPQRGTVASNLQPMSVVAKRQDGSRCHLVWRYGSAQATVC